MGCDAIPKLSIRLRNVVLETSSLRVLQIFNEKCYSGPAKSFEKGTAMIVQIEMEKFNSATKFSFVFNLGRVAFEVEYDE